MLVNGNYQKNPSISLDFERNFNQTLSNCSRVRAISDDSLKGFQKLPSFIHAPSIRHSMVSLQPVPQTPPRKKILENENLITVAPLQEDLKIKYEKLFSENEEFLVVFELLKEDFMQQVNSLLFQYDKLK